MIKWFIIVLLALGLLSLVLALSLTLGRNVNVYHPVVETNVGTIRGIEADDGAYSMFMGIPYAVVNESNPFGVSSPHPIFEGVFDAFDDTAICPQQEEFNGTIVGSLDCLQINIYVPNTASPINKLPVLVWIYGGAFITGFHGKFMFGPKFLVRHDIVYVTLNYRVGAYGFMNLDIPEIPGNQGLKDQLLALKWINDNISAFNGDENKITLMGESAGGISIDFHLLSNHEKLYHQAIMQSGCSLVAHVVRVHDNTTALRLARHLGLESDNVYEAISFLAPLDPHRVIAAENELGIDFRPSVELEFENVESFLSKHPEFISDIPKVRNMSILSGFNSYEQMYTLAPFPPSHFDDLNIFRDDLSQTFDVDNDFDQMLDIARRFYIGDERVTYDKFWEIVDFVSDIKFNHPVQRCIMKYIENEAKSVYQHLFSYDGNRNFVKILNNVTKPGATHADELGYLFDMLYLAEPITADDQLVIDRMTTMWTNFVKYGNPTPEITELLPVKWEPVTADTVNYLQIDSDLTAGKRPYHARMAFWDLFFKANHDKHIAHWDIFNRN